MSQYLEKYKKAEQFCLNEYGPGVTPALKFRPEKEPYGKSVIDDIVADFLDGVVKSASGLIGQCFHATREASYVLFEAGIDNSVTIGNVSIAGKPQFSTTAATLRKEMQKGFVPAEPANAHAWLTLDSGQVIDLTILASYAHRTGKGEPSLEEAIYLSDYTSFAQMVHTPYMTGFAYHLRVVSHPWSTDGSYACYRDWLDHVDVFRRKIARQSEP